MKAKDLIALFDGCHKRVQLIGDLSCGVIAGLDLEGRLYAVLGGEVLNRVNPAAVHGISGPGGYLNPGGDGLWPAPEGSRFGCHYATGAWRVPPGVSGARYVVSEGAARMAVLQADVDLVNAEGQGIPIRCVRSVTVQPSPHGLAITSVEAFDYLGIRPLDRRTCRIAPWTLCQFDCGPGCETVFPDGGAGCVWDLYDPSDDRRQLSAGLWHVQTDGRARFQLGLGASVPWIEFRCPARGLRVRRTAEPLAAGLDYIDLADRPAQADADPRGVRFSIYSDANGFMEIEAAGGMPAVLEPAARLAVAVTTTFDQT